MANELQQMVYKAFRNNGLSDNQAKIMTAEVGRENSYDPNVLFGMHSDPKNKAVNVGMFSWQGDRGKKLYGQLKSKGLIGSDSRIFRTQEALDAMAKFAVNEIKTEPRYAQTKKQFLSNPNVDYKTATQVLGENYIRWRYRDPEYASGHKNRDAFYRQLGGNIQQTQQQSGSAFQQALARQQQNIAPTIAKVYEAYQSGRLSPQQAKDFESDVRSGAIMLPQGASLKGRKGSAKPEAVMLPQSLADAYANNQLDSTQRADLEADIKAGLVKLPVASKFKTSLPDFTEQGQIIEQPTEQAILPTPEAPRTIAESARGAGEALLTGVTGATTGALGFAGGALGGIGQELVSGQFGTSEAARRIEQSAATGAERLTYAPRTEAGQEYVQTIGEVAAPLVALTPASAELAAITQAARGVAPIAAGQAQRVAQAAAPVAREAAQTVAAPIQRAGQAVQTGVQRAAEAVGLREAEQPQMQGANVGAMQVPQSVIREQQAVDLPVPIERMTTGQILRDPDLLKEESELAKMPAGSELVRIQEEQTAIANMNMEKFNEMTGAAETDLYEIGNITDKALRQEMEKDRAKTNAAYNAADKSEEANTVVDLSKPISDNPESATLTDYLNNQVEGATETIVPTARQLAVHHGIAQLDESGKLVPLSPTIKQMERFRADINSKVNDKEKADLRQASIIKRLIDSHTEPYEGKLYKQARSLRRAQAKRWENNQIIVDLMSNKAGTDDRKVALENVVGKIIYRSSLDDMRQVKRTLLTSGEDGKQAWKEIQGAVIRDIQTKATSGVAPDAQGQQMISPAALNKSINDLDKTGKLKFIFGERGAEQLRALNDVSKALFTTPKSAAINTSNTASALAIVLDTMATGATTGLPLPVISALRAARGMIKDKKTRERVQKSIVILQKSGSEFK